MLRWRDLSDEAGMTAVDGATALRRMILGFRLSQLVAVAAALGLVDQLHGGPRSLPIWPGRPASMPARCAA